MKGKNVKKTKIIIRYVLLFLFIVLIGYLFRPVADYEIIEFSEMTNLIRNEEVKELNITYTELTAKLDDGNTVVAYAPSQYEIAILDEKYLFTQIEEGKLDLSTDEPSSGISLISLLPTLMMMAALGFLLYIMMKQGGNGKAFSFGKNRAKMVKDGGDKKLSFKDVAGLEEEKAELEEIVDFLKDPRKYNDLGARIPKGVLLVGPPGTGKTYISRATAGEAKVPFFTISGSDFVEMFVGVGASRVRDLFTEAKKNSPCIVFIDEIDAVGRKRGAGLGGGNDEREQTLNQLLVEMDGFEDNVGIIILAATNRPDVLDPALLRPGRFDRQVVIGVPDRVGREAIFKVHSANKPLSEEVSLQVLAKRTPGFTPADIENLLNEAALITARRNGRKIRMNEIEEATTKVMAGTAKKSKVVSEKERKLVAYHEAGHAIVMRAIPDSDPVHQVTIVPRGGAGGFTMYLPKEDINFETKNRMKHTLSRLLGGRAAEQIILDDISTGASNDIMRVTDIARDMVTKYGFSSKLGLVNYSSSEEVFIGKDFSSKQAYSESIASQIDDEVKALVDDAYNKSLSILNENLDKLEAVAQALLLVETIDGTQFEKLYNGEITPEELESEVLEHEEEIKVRNEKEEKEFLRKRKEEEELAKYDGDYMNEDSKPENAEETAKTEADDIINEVEGEDK